MIAFHRNLVFTAVCFGLIAPAGCATSSRLVGSEDIVERSGDRPDWLTRIPDDDGWMYFRGVRTGAKRLDDGLTDSRQHAARQVAESILTRANIDYRRARVESTLVSSIPQDVPALVKDGLIMLASAAQQGVRERESYWEKVEERGRAKVAVHYNVFTLIRLNESDYRANAGRILGAQIEKAQQAHDAAAEAHLKGMLQRLSE